MGRIKQLQIEFEEQERAEFEELHEMNLDKIINDIQQEICEKQDELQYLKNDDEDNLEEIDDLKEEIMELEKNLEENRDLLASYNELKIKYLPNN